MEEGRFFVHVPERWGAGIRNELDEAGSSQEGPERVP